MIDVSELKRLIVYRRSFRIGARGICIDCLKDKDSVIGWTIIVPRAGMQSLNCDEIDYDPENNALICGCECGYVSSIRFDLNMYSKITEMVQ